VRPLPDGHGTSVRRPDSTIVAQPRITMSSVAGLRVLSLLGIEAAAAVGHSLGELTALHWAGAMTESELFALAAARGRVMMEASEGGGAMAGIGAGPDEVEPLLRGEPVVIAGYNGPAQTVISRLTQLGCVIALHPGRGESAIFESRRLSSPVSWLSPGLAVVSSRSPRKMLLAPACRQRA
jgi:enediyne polyketide synthase